MFLLLREPSVRLRGRPLVRIFIEPKQEAKRLGRNVQETGETF